MLITVEQCSIKSGDYSWQYADNSACSIQAYNMLIAADNSVNNISIISGAEKYVYVILCDMYVICMWYADW